MLGLYIHIPFCVQKCKYCDFNSYKIEKDKKEKFLNDLKKEMSLYTNKDRKINTIFFGGGTPSILSNTEMKSWDIKQRKIRVYEKFRYK